MIYRWPAKITKFGITDPLLKHIVVKYENEIPWQSEVRNQTDLFDYVSTVMLPKIRERVEWPTVPGAKHCFVSAHKLDLDRMLEAAQELDSEDIEIVRLLRDENGADEAVSALARVINTSKVAAFKEWTDLIDRKYTRHPAFGLLVLRSILDTTDAGSWRSVIPPSRDVLQWIFRRLTTGSLSPDQKISKVYADKLGAGFYSMPANGWQYVSQSSNPDQLVAACRGSGWCIADRRWATQYLRNYAFYLLRANGRAVVALRVRMDSGRQVVEECQGLSNTSPTEYLIDVHVFLLSLDIQLDHREEVMAESLSEIGDIRDKDALWWEERERYWPFAGIGIRQDVQEVNASKGGEQLAPYLHFPSIHMLISGKKIPLSVSDWVKLIEVRPALYDGVPESEANLPEIVEACVRGWVGQLGENDMNFDLFLEIPYRIRSHETFRVCAQAVYPDFLKRNIMPSAEAWSLYLPSLAVREEYGDAVGFKFQYIAKSNSFRLLDSADDDRPDSVFDVMDQTSLEFPVMRQEAWSMAIDSCPEMWFALPEDLGELEQFRPRSGSVKRVNLGAWEEKLRERPWMLSQRNVVPYSVRFHERILAAYMQGWLRNFARKPWLKYVPRGLYGKAMIMLPALCYHPDFVSGVEAIFRNGRNQLPDAWRQSRHSSVRKCSWYQVAILRAIDPDNAVGGISKTEYQLAKDIGMDLITHETSIDTRYSAEVRDRLCKLGFRRHLLAA